MLDSILKDIAAPGVEMHGAPFFDLNAKLDPEEMRREMNLFHTMGMGGCFLHTRVGLATPYLGKDYMDSLRAAVEECEKLGLKPWLYDEDRWPSGAAGGLVTKDPRYRMRKLVFLEAGEEMDTTVHLFLGQSPDFVNRISFYHKQFTSLCFAMFLFFV